MNDQKDNQKSTMNSYGHSTKTDEKPLDNKHSSQTRPVYEFASKKTEKLVTALYMITDCMEQDDALKSKLRILGVDLLSSIYKLSILSPVEKDSSITEILVRIGEIVAFVEISHTIGFVSEMNATILKKEFNLLNAELYSYQSKNQATSFSGVLFENQKKSAIILSDAMFDIPEEAQKITHFNALDNQQINTIKDISYKGQIDKKTTNDTMSFKNNFITSPFSSIKNRPLLSECNTATKEERSTKILAIIKNKDTSGGISIKDISSTFVDCSEKTIQRELNTLVEKGQIRKIGEKRWSRYQVITN